jgi:hypothetical protein
MERFVGFSPNQTGDRQLVANALGRLLQMALIALVRSQK